jgi:hypothetical protein
MRKVFFVFALFLTAYAISAQRLPTVGILAFTAGAGMSEADAAEAARQVTEELSSWGAMTVYSGDRAEEGEYLVRGQVSRQNNRVVLSGTTSIAGTGRSLNNSREEASTLSAISFVSFCAQLAENIPFPNYLLGTWRSTIDMIDGPVSCVLEFRSDRTIRVVQYDTWEHNGTNILKYQGIGTGTYTYAGYLRRTVTVNGRNLQSDATVGVNLNLEDTLPKYASLNEGNLRLLFDEGRVNFELVSGNLPCGDNYTGPSVYPNENIFYTRFRKIQ